MSAHFKFRFIILFCIAAFMFGGLAAATDEILLNNLNERLLPPDQQQDAEALNIPPIQPPDHQTMTDADAAKNKCCCESFCEECNKECAECCRDCCTAENIACCCYAIDTTAQIIDEQNRHREFHERYGGNCGRGPRRPYH